MDIGFVIVAVCWPYSSHFDGSMPFGFMLFMLLECTVAQ